MDSCSRTSPATSVSRRTAKARRALAAASSRISESSSSAAPGEAGVGVDAEEAGRGRGDLGERLQQDRERRGSGVLGGVVEVRPAVVDRAQQPGGVLGALGVAAQPEHVLGDAGGDRQRQHLGRRGLAHPGLDGRGAAGVADPDVLGGRRRLTLRQPAVVGADLAQAAGHHLVAGPVATAKVRSVRSWGNRSSDRMDGAVEQDSASWPTQAHGSASIRATRSVALGRRRAPSRRRGVRPIPRASGLTTSRRQASRGPCASPSASPHHQVGTDFSRSGSSSSSWHRPGRNGSRPGFSRTPQPSPLTTETEPGAGGLDQAGHAELGVRAQVEGVAVPGVDPAQDHVDLLEAAQGLLPDPAVGHDQVLAAHQRVAEQGGQVGLLEGGLARGARGQQHGARGLRGGRGDLLQADPHRVEERAEPVDLGLRGAGAGSTRETTRRLAIA